MPLSPGTRLGAYEVLAPLGAGAMGEVYRARDPKLERDVAIKVLPAVFASDADSLMRFDREVRAVAALSHPNILAIYELEREGERSYAVTELLEGETLRSRLARGPIPPRKAAEYARQVAHGLAAAHEKGIVHRDIKPENLFVTRDGHVKILDFGLASVESPVPEVGGSSSPTAAVATAKGGIVGTVGYLAPEQARGEKVDARADIFSLGVVLYEMITGRRPFQRDSGAEMLSALLRDDPPPPSDANPQVPRALDLIVLHCLEKSPAERFQSGRDLAFHLDSLSGSTSQVGLELPAIDRRRRSRRLAGLLIAILLGAAVSFELGRRVGARGGDASPAGSLPASFRQLTDLPGEERNADLSPTGAAFVFVSDVAGNPDVYVQRVTGRNAINLTADSPTSDRAPDFSPDGESIAFRSERDSGGIFVMGTTGESVRRLTDFGYDPDWSPDGGRIVFSAEEGRDPWLHPGTGRLYVLDLATEEIAPLGAEGEDAVQPSWSPHGHRIAYWGLHGSSGQRDLWTVAAGGSEAGPVGVTDDAAFDWSPAWSPDGRFLYFASDRGGAMNLWRVRIDESTGRTLSAPEPVTTPSRTSGEVSLSADGSLMAFVSWDYRSTLERAGLDPATGALSEPPRTVLEGSRVIADQALSPDGEWIAFATRGVQEDLFVVRVDGSSYRQLTDDPFRDRSPNWSPDGTRIAFFSDRSGSYDAWAIRPDGRDLEPLSETPGQHRWRPVWSPDGERLATYDAERTYIIELSRPLAERVGVPIPLPEEGSRPLAPISWSPDGRFLAGALQLAGGGPTYVYSLDSETYTRVGDARGYAVWAGDSRHLLVTQAEDVVLVDTLTGAKRSVLNRSATSLSASRDGRRISFLESSVEADVWLAELR